MSRDPDVIVFTAETRIFDALACSVCKAEPDAVETCPNCAGKGGEPRVVEVFQRLGMRCWRKGDAEPCVATEKESLSEAAMFHDLDLQKLLDELNGLRLAKPPERP